MLLRAETLSDKTQSERIIKAGVPSFTSSMTRTYTDDATDTEQQGVYPVWTFEELLHACRLAAKKDELRLYEVTDFLVFFVGELTFKEEEIPDDDYISTYLDELIDLIELRPEMFDFSRISEKQFWIYADDNDPQKEERVDRYVPETQTAENREKDFPDGTPYE